MRGGPPAWGLGEVLTTSHHKNMLQNVLWLLSAKLLDLRNEA